MPKPLLHIFSPKPIADSLSRSFVTRLAQGSGKPAREEVSRARQEFCSELVKRYRHYLSPRLLPLLSGAIRDWHALAFEVARPVKSPRGNQAVLSREFTAQDVAKLAEVELRSVKAAQKALLLEIWQLSGRQGNSREIAGKRQANLLLAARHKKFQNLREQSTPGRAPAISSEDYAQMHDKALVNLVRTRLYRPGIPTTVSAEISSVLKQFEQSLLENLGDAKLLRQMKAEKEPLSPRALKRMRLGWKKSAAENRLRRFSK